MKVSETKIDGLLIIEPKVHGDERGFFVELHSDLKYREICGTSFVQDNLSHSQYGVIRGLHYQRGEHAQAKLVTVLSGEVLDVAVDLRPSSPTYGEYVVVLLSGANHYQFFIPRGFAHGFSVLSPSATFVYKCDNYYHPASESGIRWDDPTLHIDWRIPNDHQIISPKDAALPYLHAEKRRGWQ